MKTQLFGRCWQNMFVYVEEGFLCVERDLKPVHSDFKSKRENGEDQDNPKDLLLEYDGKNTWIKNEVKDDYVYGVKRPDDHYDYEVRYVPGPKDLAYFEAKDRNYLTRIWKKGNLRKEEPAVWYLYETDNSKNLDIADWWSQKLKLSTEELDKLLKYAEVMEKECDKKCHIHTFFAVGAILAAGAAIYVSKYNQPCAIL
jgi:hypothetical protein